MKRYRVWQGLSAVAALLVIVSLAVGFGPFLLRHLPFPGCLHPVPFAPKYEAPLQIPQQDENGNGRPGECYVPAGVIIWNGLPPDGKPVRKTVFPSVFRIFVRDNGWLGGTLEAENANSAPDSVGAGEGWIRESDAVYPESRPTVPLG